MRSSLGRGQLASSLNLLLPDALATGNLTIIPDAAVRDITVDKNTGRVTGANFLDRHSSREMHARAKVVVLGASCLESTRILLNSGLANSSGVLGTICTIVLHAERSGRDSEVAIKPPAGYAGRGLYSPVPQPADQRERFSARVCV
jgi:choline dehydrogenase-like flavoprotein